MIACIQKRTDVIIEILINIPALKIKKPITHAAANNAAIIKRASFIHSFYWYIEKMMPAPAYQSQISTHHATYNYFTPGISAYKFMVKILNTYLD